MTEWTETRVDLLERLGTDPALGLASGQVEVNRQKYGDNSLSRRKPESILARIIDALKEPMILMLILAWLFAMTVNIIQELTSGEANFLECAGIFAAIVISVFISVVMENRSAKAFEALSKISSDIVVKAIRDGHTLMLNKDSIVVGDILLLEAGDQIPADGRLLEAIGLSTDESTLTGESIHAEKDSERKITDVNTPLAERTNMLFAGTYITAGYCRMIVTATGNSTEFGKIALELGRTLKTSTPLQEKLTRLGKTITLFGIIVSSIVLSSQLVIMIWHDTLTLPALIEVIITSIVLIVAVVPEGLPTAVAISLSLNVIKLSRQNALVKKLVASETIGSVNVICSDKTGTLTENRMTVVGFYDNSWHTDISKLSSASLITNLCINSTADISQDGSFLGNPTECAMLNFYEKSEVRLKGGLSYREERARHEVVQTFPFTSELKHMTTVARLDGKLVAWVKGSPESLFAMCSIAADEKEKIEQSIQNAQEKAMRVIAFAHRELDTIRDYNEESAHHEMESNMHFDGFVAISDPLRSDVHDAIMACRNAGIDLKILTGDNIVTAKAIANELHLLDNDSIAMEASELTSMSDDELLEKLPTISVIARSTPSVKMRVVKLLKQAGHVVAVTGDGINDAPSLKNADVGIAMGISGTEVSKEASDIVLLDDSFATITSAIEWGRNVYENFKRFITFQLTVNLAAVIVVLASVFMGLKVPFSALALLWINIIMDGPPALSLGLEPERSDIMTRRPVSRNEDIISAPMVGIIIGTAFYISGVFLAQYVYNFLNATEGEMTTVLFTLFVFFQLFNAFNCRELHRVSLFKNIHRNRIMLFATACTFILQIFIVEFSGPVFGTVPLSLGMWAKLFCTTFTVILFGELARLIVRHTNRQEIPIVIRRDRI